MFDLEVKRKVFVYKGRKNEVELRPLLKKGYLERYLSVTFNDWQMVSVWENTSKEQMRKIFDDIDGEMISDTWLLTLDNSSYFTTTESRKYFTMCLN